MRDATTRRPVRLAPVLLVAVALVAGCGSPAPSPSVNESPGANPSGLASAAPGTSPAPAQALISLVGTPDADGWSHIATAEAPPVATLEPLNAGAGAVAPDTDFRLTSLDGRDPAQLARALVGDPVLAFEVVSVMDDSAIVRPEGGLVPGTTYRIALTRPDGTAEAAWVTTASGPIEVTDSIPGNAATRVPLDTAIELTFNQYGVTVDDFGAKFSIAPAVPGRFEAHGRSMAFLPDRPLAKSTLYAVTIRRGLPLPGTGQVLERDVVIRFETVGKAPSKTTARFVRTLVETSTADRARVTVALQAPSQKSMPRSLEVSVHSVPGLDAAVDAWHAITDAPEWTRVSTVEPVATAGLRQVFAGTVSLTKLDDWGTRWFSLPKRFPAGWYVVTERWAGIPRQVLLQVSDLATFALIADDRTAVWVNDVRTDKTVPGATASLAGQDLGRTDKRGLLVAPTPEVVSDARAGDEALLVVSHDGQTTFRGTGIGGGNDTPSYDEGMDPDGWYGEDWGYGGWGSADDAWWRLLSTDRMTYRSTDTINAWGMARSRDTGTVPGNAVVRLRAAHGASVAPLIASESVAPDANGAFAVALPIRDLPDGSYTLELVVDGTTIAEQWLEVGELSKPAWQMELTTDRRAVIAPASVLATVRATFYEGTPVAGARIEFSAYGDDAVNTGSDERVVTDGFGTASHKVSLAAGPGCQPCWVEIDAYPDVPEEADFEAGVSVDVFAASAVVDAEAILSGTRLRVTGKVSDVELARYAQALPDEEVDFRGSGRAGARVHLEIVEHWSVTRQTGTRYDRIEKKVVPVYRTSYKQRTVLGRSVATAGNGEYALALDVVGGKRSYEMTASYSDEQGRATQTTTWANEDDEDEGEDDSEYAQLVNADSHADPEEQYDGSYRVGDTVRVEFVGATDSPPLERYLYAIAQRGLRYVTVGDTPTFRSTFDDSWLPGAWITGVRFTGVGYETAVSDYIAGADLKDRALSVSVTPDLERYEPGGTATVAIRTLGPDGAPVAASVYLKAVDEKLYAIDAVYDTDPLQDLYAMVGDGLLAEVRSHRAVEEDWINCCDTTGGGGDERSDFRDWLVATLVMTDADGRATLEVPLSDDLTSWRVVATAVDGKLRAGQGAGRLAVGLPFFAEATLKSEYLAADRPVLRVRGFGSALREADRVTFTVSSDTLPMAATDVEAPAFGSAEVQLPRLTVGDHQVRIEASAGDGRSDVLVRTFRVVDSRAVRRDTTWSPLEQPTALDAGSGRTFTYLTLTDTGRGRVIPVLERLTWTDGVRSDQRLAAGLAERILAGEFGMDAAPGTEAGLGRFLREKGLALVAHGSAQLEVTALAAMTGDPQLDAVWLRAPLEAVAFDSTELRERRLVALAGLAALGEPVLGEVRASAGQANLTLEEQISLALAAFHAGDEALAGRLERAVLDAHGRARGPWLRLDTGDPEADALQTARLAIVSASLGRHYAADMDAWLEANPPRTTVVDLERALAARGWLQRVSGPEAVAALWVDGSRREVAIRGGNPVTVQLTPVQASSARLEPVAGQVLVVTQRDVPLHAGGLTPPDGVTITRTVTPAGDIRATDTVIVTLTVRLARAARAEPWTVTDWAPSGLAPVGGGDWNRASPPTSITGQRVVFQFGENRKTGTWTLRYIARVVTPGTYRWEPAVLQSDVNPDEGLLLPPDEITIRSLGSPGAIRPTPTPQPTADPTTAPTPQSTAEPVGSSTPVPSPQATPQSTPSPRPATTPGATLSPPPMPSQEPSFEQSPSP